MVSDDRLGESESSSKRFEAKVSTSKSGFTDRDFILVLKNLDGGYSSPQKIPRELALSIATNFAENEEAARKYSINKSIAKFILAKALRKGLISKPDTTADDFDLEGIATDSMERNGNELHARTSGEGGPATSERTKPEIERQPKYFPAIDRYFSPELADKVIEVIAFVLSGVDPSQLQDQRVVQRTLSLRQLVQMSVARISPGLLMHDDHWYVLAHFHHLSRDEFKLAWEEAQSQATGQANTDVVKVITKLDKFRIDSAANCMEDPANKSFFLEVQGKSVELLSRNFRRIRRKIESVYELPAPVPVKKSWLDKLLKRSANDQSTVSPVQVEVIDLVREYLIQAIKIGRILRSDVLKKQRQLNA